MSIDFDDGADGCDCCSRWRWALAAAGQECRRMEDIAIQAIVERDEAREQVLALLHPVVPHAKEKR